jgi:hypothetical protein
MSMRILLPALIVLSLASPSAQGDAEPRNFLDDIKLPVERQDQATREVVGELTLVAVSTPNDAAVTVRRWLLADRALYANSVLKATAVYRLPPSAGPWVGQLAWEVVDEYGGGRFRAFQVFAMSRRVCALAVNAQRTSVRSTGCQ